MTICESEVETNNAVKPVTYIAFEIPASLVLKKLRASRLIPFFIIAWSIVIVGSAFVTNYAGLLATRLLLGAFESGLFPCLTLYLSTFYKKEEQARRASDMSRDDAIVA